MKKSWVMFMLVALTVLLAACGGGGGQEDPKAFTTPYQDQIDTMQRAVDAYREETGGLLPIKTRDQSVDPYIKYPIEFEKIVPKYTEKLPLNAYERGGVYQYVLYDVEENPTVKLVDIRAAERIRELNLRKHVNSSVKFGEEIADAVYAVQYEEMGFNGPLTVPSPYSETQLPIVVGGDGNFYVDYSIDLANELKKTEFEVKEGEDIRYILAEAYNVLPAYSLPYTLNEEGEPTFSARPEPKTTDSSSSVEEKEEPSEES